MKYYRYKPYTEVSFSNLSDHQIEEALTEELDLSTLGLEERILTMLGELQSDRDRVIFLLMILKSNGYTFRYKDIGRVLGVAVPWIKKLKMRVVKRLKEHYAA